ncbi:MAG: glutamine-hydrolyzing carbamoyl-phosphate synthase small subunit [Helicobacteraceae bacterium]|nr:glutamine-hydrolyzing carbamoyl-phosphate synthase small subunit [Helicobacteraceae bacterium]
MKPVNLYFENGILMQGKCFGAEGTTSGEVVFNTSMTGYQEIITDPSYAGQFITFTMPEIGNVGANAADCESRGVFCRGVIARNYQDAPSNYRSESSLAEFLKSRGILGICDIDTRALTKLIRKDGAMMMVASTEHSSYADLRAVLDATPKMSDINFLNQVGSERAFAHSRAAWNDAAQRYDEPKANPLAKVLAFDFGAKLNILNELVSAGLEVEVTPHNTPAEAVIERFDKGEIGGVFLSNGPGDPMVLKDEVAAIKKLINHKIPIFGICLGHQLLAIAHGYETYKLKFGHHGANQPVKNLRTGAVEITSQNHNYSVPDTIKQVAEITHLNLFDGTIEGVRYKNSPCFSVQHHPEASPGPRESRYIFAEFAKLAHSRGRYW